MPAPQQPLPHDRGLRQAVVFVSAFFSSVAYSRKILPESAFQATRIGQSSVQGLIAPSTRFSETLHKGLYSWITNALQNALSKESNITASLIIMQRYGGNKFGVLEAFQVVVHQRRSRDQNSQHLLTSVHCVLRALRMYIDTMPSLPGDFEPFVDICEGVIPFDSITEDDIDDLFIDDDPCFIAPQPGGISEFKSCLRRLKKKTSFGMVETASMDIECTYYTLK